MSTGKSPGSSPSSPMSNHSLPVSSSAKERSDLLAKARAFLRSPAVISQKDVTTRREFLKDKGLSNEDIEQLLSESVRIAMLSEKPIA
jgi:Pex14 N-terminal domain